MEPKPHQSRTLRDPADLVAEGLAAPAQLDGLARVAERYAVALTPAVLELIAAHGAPIARQFVPSTEELTDSESDRSDPIGDDAHSPLPGLVHRYPDRVLIKPILVCPVYCRFCFRRETVGDGEATLTAAQLDAALAYVAERPAIREVILTGGDPLMLGPARLGALLGRIAAIGHVELIRVHTRVPVADPERITAALAAALRPPQGAELAVWLAVHVNHAAELSVAARAALARLADAGLPLLSQTVLLKGVNDSVDALEALFRALVRNRVRPYYLHHPDLAPGTAHFRPTIAEGQALVRALRGRLTGIAQPTYVLDIPGGAGKVPVGPEFWDGQAQTVEDWQGARHPYTAC